MTLLPLKYCGIRSESDFRRAGELGIRAVGFNFYRKSIRYLDADAAAAIGTIQGEDRPPLERWGVFVHAGVDSIVDIARRARLDVAQISGDETGDFLAELKDRLNHALPAVRIVRVLKTGNDLFDRAERLRSSIDAFLLDANIPGQYGGSGKTADWDLARRFCEIYPNTILAGGLNPDNVADAWKTVRPAMLDTASGIENAAKPGIKSHEKMKAMAEALRAVLRDDDAG